MILGGCQLEQRTAVKLGQYVAAFPGSAKCIAAQGVDDVKCPISSYPSAHPFLSAGLTSQRKFPIVARSSIHIHPTFHWWISAGPFESFPWPFHRRFEATVATGPEKLRGAFGASATAQTQHILGGVTSLGGVSSMASSNPWNRRVPVL